MCNWARGKRPLDEVMKIMWKQVGPLLIGILKYTSLSLSLFSSLRQPAVPDEEERVGKVVGGIKMI